MSDRGEPRSWDPTTPGICALWFDATTITGVANGATITSWVPRTGIYTLTGTATYEAGAGLAVAGGGGPFPGVYFGGSDALQASGADYAQPYTLAVVASSMPASGTNFSTFCDSRSGCRCRCGAPRR